MGIFGPYNSIWYKILWIFMWLYNNTIGLIPGLAISVRRLNDAGYTWKSLLWSFCPLVGWIIVLVRLCKKSA